MIPEKYFFMYAFPCAYLKLERGDITKKEHEELERNFLNSEIVDKKYLEKIFAPAFVWIKEIADNIGKEIWDLEVIKFYWEKEHNKVINQGKGSYKNHPESLKDLCRIHIAEIIKKQDNRLLVKYEEKERVVFNILVPQVKVGDKVKIHYAYAIEKLN